MTDRSSATRSFDLRLERVLGAYAEAAIRPVDVVAIAEQSILLERRRSTRRPWTWLAAAAVLVTLTLVAVAALADGPNPFDWLTARPSVTPTQASDGIPVVLQARWMGGPRAIGTLAPSAGTYIAIDGERLCVSGRDYSQACTLLLSSASASSATASSGGLLRLTTPERAVGCDAGTIGTYQWSVSTGGGMLSLAPVDEACAARHDGIAGTWFRSDCRNATDDCLGLLEAGTYPSQFLHVTGPSGTYPASDFGAITYTVPAGWANSGDWPVLLSLTPAADYGNETENGAVVGAYHELDLFAHPLVAAQTTDCNGTAQGFITNPTPAQVEAWLANVAALRVTPRGTTGLAGLPAVAMDIQLAPGWSSICPGEALRSADYLVLRDDPGHGFTPRLRGDEIQRLILADLGDGDLLAIVIDSSDPARFGDLISAAMPIVNSIVIR